MRIVESRIDGFDCSYKARIICKERRRGFLWLKKSVMYRGIIDRCFVSWKPDYLRTRWYYTKTAAEVRANQILDSIENWEKTMFEGEDI